MRRKEEEEEGGGIKRKDTRSNPWYINNPAAKSNGITADTVLDFLDRPNSAGKTKTRLQKWRGFDDRSETQRDGNLVGSLVVRIHTSLGKTTSFLGLSHFLELSHLSSQ